MKKQGSYMNKIVQVPNFTMQGILTILEKYT